MNIWVEILQDSGIRKSGKILTNHGQIFCTQCVILGLKNFIGYFRIPLLASSTYVETMHESDPAL